VILPRKAIRFGADTLLKQGSRILELAKLHSCQSGNLKSFGVLRRALQIFSGQNAGGGRIAVREFPLRFGQFFSRRSQSD
jgi:hypothetical protein